MRVTSRTYELNTSTLIPCVTCHFVVQLLDSNIVIHNFMHAVISEYFPDLKLSSIADEEEPHTYDPVSATSSHTLLDNKHMQTQGKYTSNLSQSTSESMSVSNLGMSGVHNKQYSMSRSDSHTQKIVRVPSAERSQQHLKYSVMSTTKPYKRQDDRSTTHHGSYYKLFASKWLRQYSLQ